MTMFGKICTAMITPFDAKGNIDFQKTEILIEYLLNHGTESLVVSGTTGEAPTLTKEEKIALIKHVVKVVAGRVPVIAGTGGNNTKATIELTKRAEEIGADAVMLVAPYYNKPNQEGLYEHFKSVAENTKLPVMLYNIPGRTGVNIETETVVALSRIPNIVAIKDASGNLNQMARIIANTPRDFALYSGDDSLALPVLAIGGHGVVSVASHIIGNEMQEMYKAFLSGDHEKAAEWHRKLLPLMEGLFEQPSPAPVKTALQLIGLNVGSVRLPLVPLGEDSRMKLTALLQDLKK